MERPTIVRTELVPITSIHTHPDNARRGDIAKIEKSLREHGQFKPIVVHEETGDILAGNHTHRVMRDKLGETHILATFVRCSEAQARAILAADNRTADGAGYDDEALARLLEQLNDDDLLGAAGYATDDLDNLLAKLEETSPLPQDDMYQPGGDKPVETAARPSLNEMKEAYETSASRLVMLSYTPDRYVWVVKQLEVLADKLDLDTNADVVLQLISDATGQIPPEATS